ncbi:hypothetical protein Cpha266_0163 [Chlorobium phaeobacteroides DSM 266]|uniref:Uncharacterized protein n=1 Tax=Chlorobium phaeobacteroides (strain DSM 266 / SMG 266 / 2430) TaxID=290317 RepID=A1BCV3_CHLPD|nr:hypothetical protein Cpha266_0163 [Chlorobium phaeobacteroides DSM 266]
MIEKRKNKPNQTETISSILFSASASTDFTNSRAKENPFIPTVNNVNNRYAIAQHQMAQEALSFQYRSSPDCFIKAVSVACRIRELLT